MSSYLRTLVPTLSGGNAGLGQGGASAAVRFGSFELDRKAGELRRKGRPVALQPQPLKLLDLLASRSGELVTRDEIRAHLWGEETFVDYEQGIAYCVREVRRALGDSARSSRYVETVPGQGFRFIAETRPALAPSPRRAGWSRVRWRLVAGLLVAFLALTVGLTALRFMADESPRLAVLPFESLNGGVEGELQARGLTEELIAWLGRRLKGRVDVLAPHSVFRQRERSGALSEAAEVLAVDYLVEGTVRHSESGVRVAVRLVESPGALTLWTGEYDTTLEDPVALQIRLGHEIGEALGWELLPEESPRISAATRRDLDRARAYHRRITPEGLEKALHLLELALEREPTAARLWLEMGRVRRERGEAERAADAFERAMSLDPRLAEAYSELALVRLYSSVELAAADRLFARALELNPSLARAHQVRAFLYSALGRHQEALTAIARARSLDPLFEKILADGGWISYFAHRFEEADARCTESIEFVGGFRWAHLCRVLSRDAQGDAAGAWQAARAEMRALGFGKPDDPEVASLAADEALRRYWRWRLEWLESPSSGLVAPTELADCHMGLGEKEAALSALERAFELNFGWERLHLPYHPLYEPLRDEPRFRRLLVRLTEKRNGSEGTES